MSAAATWTIAGVRTALETKKMSARELAGEFYRRIEKQNPTLNAYLTLSPERAYAQADRVDAAIARGESLPALAGVPIAIKDVISTQRHTHHVRLENSGKLRSALRRDGGRAARQGGRGIPRQDELRRICDGQLE